MRLGYAYLRRRISVYKNQLVCCQDRLFSRLRGKKWTRQLHGRSTRSFGGRWTASISGSAGAWTRWKKRQKQIGSLVLSVERLAVSMENMNRSLAEQGDKLEALENRDGELWRKVTGYIVTTIIGLVLGFVFRQIGM